MSVEAEDAFDDEPCSFLRSQCGGETCLQGRGIEFKSRISPSPARSSRSRSTSRCRSIRARRTLFSHSQVEDTVMSDLTKEPRVHKLSPIQEQFKNVARVLKKTATRVPEDTQIMPNNFDRKSVASCGASKPPWEWINEPRTGFTYAESFAYSPLTGTDNEVAMPNMCRYPLSKTRTPLKRAICETTGWLTSSFKGGSVSWWQWSLRMLLRITAIVAGWMYASSKC